MEIDALDALLGLHPHQRRAVRRQGHPPLFDRAHVDAADLVAGLCDVERRWLSPRCAVRMRSRSCAARSADKRAFDSPNARTPTAAYPPAFRCSAVRISTWVSSVPPLNSGASRPAPHSRPGCRVPSAQTVARDGVDAARQPDLRQPRGLGLPDAMERGGDAPLGGEISGRRSSIPRGVRPAPPGGVGKPWPRLRRPPDSGRAGFERGSACSRPVRAGGDVAIGAASALAVARSCSSPMPTLIACRPAAPARPRPGRAVAPSCSPASVSRIQFLATVAAIACARTRSRPPTAPRRGGGAAVAYAPPQVQFHAALITPPEPGAVASIGRRRGPAIHGRPGLRARESACRRACSTRPRRREIGVVGERFGDERLELLVLNVAAQLSCGAGRGRRSTRRMSDVGHPVLLDFDWAWAVF